MKFTMDERIKHRLTGLVVILSIAVVFLPAMMKKSNQHFENSLNASLKIPPKPALPKVVIPKQTAMIKSVKVAHVDVPQVAERPLVSVIAKAEPLNPAVLPAIEAEKPLKSVIATAIVPKKSVPKTVAMQKKGYGLQLASFSKESNAEYLVARLRKQGYEANYTLFNGKNGQYYQVVANPGSKKEEAIQLQKKIAANMQLNGFIIQTGVS